MIYMFKMHLERKEQTLMFIGNQLRIGFGDLESIYHILKDSFTQAQMPIQCAGATRLCLEQHEASCRQLMLVNDGTANVQTSEFDS